MQPGPEEEGLIDRDAYAKMARELGLHPDWRPQVGFQGVRGGAANCVRPLGWQARSSALGKSFLGRPAARCVACSPTGQHAAPPPCPLPLPRPMQVSLLLQLGVRGAELAKLAKVREVIFLTKPATLRRKLDFLREAVGLRCAGRRCELGEGHAVGPPAACLTSHSLRVPAGRSRPAVYAWRLPCSDADLAKVVTKFPRIMEYQMKRTVAPRLDFLRKCGLPQDALAKVSARAGAPGAGARSSAGGARELLGAGASCWLCCCASSRAPMRPLPCTWSAAP